MTLRGPRDGLAMPEEGAPARLLVIADTRTDMDLVHALIADRFPHAQVLVEVEVGLAPAMRRLRNDQFDLVLIDLSGPGPQGASVVGPLRRAHLETPIMVVTGPTDGHLGLWARVDGARSSQGATAPNRPGAAAAILSTLQGGTTDRGARRYRNLARGLLDALDAPTCAVDADSRVVAVNHAWRAFSDRNGGSQDASGVGVSYLRICEGDDGTGSGTETDGAIVAAGLRQVLDGTIDLFHHDYDCHSPHEDRWFSVRVTPAAINGGRGAVISHIDVTSMREIEQALAYQSAHDALTGLPNRAAMADRVRQGISEAERLGRGVAIAHVDLSGFRRINDRFQYSGGDDLLVQVAERLLAHLGPGDTVARASGDEFLVLRRDVDPDKPADAVALGQRLLDALEHPFAIAGTVVPISGCVGVAHHVAGQSVERTLQAAGLALAEAKTGAPGQLALFTGEIERAVTERTALEMDLRMALTGTVDQFLLHYQPVVDLASGTVIGVEALVRWEHPVLGMVSPDQFVAMAETTGVIHELGAWVLDQAIADAEKLTYEGRELDIAVNFSVLQLDDQLIPALRQTIEGSGLRPGRLIMEVTESALVEDEDVVARTLEAVSRLGVAIAIDDFGTGYSSLHYLRRYPFNTIKIDREFVAGIGESVDDEAICRSIISLADAVGALTVSEGVETTEQYRLLRSMGCHHGQGYLWSRPVPIGLLPAAIAACGDVPVMDPRSRMVQTPDVQTPR